MKTGVLVAAGVAAASCLACPAEVTAQLASAAMPTARVAPRVFLDCQGQVPCDRTHYRTEIQWVNWMNDRADSDVHVFLTSEAAGGGGRRFTLDFAGLGAMETLTDRLTYTSSGTDVQIETLEGITQALRLGLVRYAVEAGLGRDIQLAMAPSGILGGAANDGSGPALPAPAQEPYDPWNYWTFRAGLSGNVNVQERQERYQFNPSLGADRITEDWKVNAFVRFNVDRQTTELSSGTREDVRDNWNFNSLVVRSVSPHVSAGVDFGGGSSVQENRDARVTVTPSVEWNYYPYTEANRRQLVALYGAGVQYNDYADTTAFDVVQETVPLHRFQIQYRAVEGWGNAGVSFDASQYLHGSGLYSFGASANVSFRVARGLDISLSASGERIQDEIHTPREDLSDEDILAGIRALPSGYNYQASVGFNFRWGSSFSNVVNTRMPTLSNQGGGGGGAPPGGRAGGGGGRGGGGGGF